MKVLSFNVGYFLGYRSQREWLRRPHRIFFGSKRASESGMASLVELIDRERPDVIALQEVDQGSYRARFHDQSQEIITRIRKKGLDYQFRADTKYGPETLISDVPIFKNMSNMLLWDEGTAHAHYLSHGTKQLVHVLKRHDEQVLLSVHLSKTKSTREKQLQELASIIEDYQSVVLMGDFNVKDEAEFEILTNDLRFSLHAPGKSFSTAYPTYAYDVFLTSRDISVPRCELLDDVTTSDHIPIIAEIE